MKIKEIREKSRLIDEKLRFAKRYSEFQSANREFIDLQNELRDKGFPLHNFKRLAYSIAYGYRTVKELNEKSILTNIPIFMGPNYCIA